MLKDAPLFAYLPASDIARARAFYEGKLGFEPGAMVGDGVTYTFGKGTAAFLYASPNAGTNKASQAFWQVTDIEQEVATLKAKGVTFESYPGMDMPNGISTEGGAKAAWFKDTEGNILALIQSI